MSNQVGAAECLVGIAGVLLAQNQVVKATRLLGAAEALQKSVGVSLWPANQIEHVRILARLKSSLDAPMLTAAWAAGQALTTERAIAEALEKS